MCKLVFLLSIVIIISACGKKGPLLYPDLLVPASPSDVTAQQFDKSIKLSFVLPSKDMAGRKLTGLTGVKIIRRDESSGQILNCSFCTDDYTLFKKMNLDQLPSGTQRYSDMLMLLDYDVHSGTTYTYRVAAVSKDNQEGSLSAPCVVVMTTALLPPELQLICQPTEIQLNIVGMPPGEGNIVGYNIYRALKGEAFLLKPQNSRIISDSHYTDLGLERGTTYFYAVSEVVRLPAGGMIESRLSNKVEGKLKDDE